MPEVTPRQAVAARDRALVLRVRKGDAIAFRELFEHYHRPLFRFCARYSVLDRDQVTDAVQTAFVKAHTEIEKLHDPGRFGPWLFTIARNHILSLLRHQRAEYAALKDLAQNPLLHDDPYLHEQILQALEKAIEEVADDNSKRIASLYYGPTRVTTKQIAEQLGVPKGTVTVKLQRLRQRLHRVLAQWLLDYDAPDLALNVSTTTDTGGST